MMAVMHSFGEGKNNSELKLVEIHGGGRTWPGSVQYLPKRIIGKVSNDIDASLAIWKFMSPHSLP